MKSLSLDTLLSIKVLIIMIVIVIVIKRTKVVVFNVITRHV